MIPPVKFPLKSKVRVKANALQEDTRLLGVTATLESYKSAPVGEYAELTLDAPVGGLTTFLVDSRNIELVT